MNRTSTGLPVSYLFRTSELKSMRTPHTEKPIRNYASLEYTVADRLGWLSKYSPYNLNQAFSFFHLSKRKCERIQSRELNLEEVLARKVKKHLAVNAAMGQSVPLGPFTSVSIIKLNPPHKVGILDYIRRTPIPAFQESTLCSYLQKYRCQAANNSTSPNSVTWHRSSKQPLSVDQLQAKAKKYADIYVKLAFLRRNIYSQNHNITSFFMEGFNIEIPSTGIPNKATENNVTVRLALRNTDTHASETEITATSHSMTMLFKERSGAAKLSYQKLIILSFLAIFLYWLFFPEQTTPNKN